jgi:hypothetical protein
MMCTLFLLPWPPEFPVGASFLLVEEDILGKTPNGGSKEWLINECEPVSA